MRAVIPAFLLLTGFSAVCLAKPVVEHVCQHSYVQKEAQRVHEVNELPKPVAQSSGTALAATSGSVEEEWQPIRIRIATEPMEDQTLSCQKVGQRISGIASGSKTCKDEDLPKGRPGMLLRIVRSAIHMHATRLKVKPIKYGFKVPNFFIGVCHRLDVPTKHITDGVTDADFLLYVASFPPVEKNSYASSAICAKLKSDGRPVVGFISYNMRDVSGTAYHVRVAAHEIAHVLGFSRSFMNGLQSLKVKTKDNVRGKDEVTEVQGDETVKQTKKHFGCDSATGMELEDEQEFSHTESDSHWERRNARDELMAGIVGRGLYTKLTLAAFQDMGFYRAEFDKAETMEWGANAGCDFLEKPCIENGVSKFPTMFCTDEQQTKQYCAPGRRATGRCSEIKTHRNNNKEYKYFADAKKSGNREILTDRCPIIEEHDDTSCLSSAQNAAKGVKGANSWCLWKTNESTGTITEYNYEALCGAIAYDVASNKLRVGYDNTDVQKQEQCKDGKFTAKQPFANVVLACPSQEEVRTGSVEYNAVLLEGSSQALNAIKVRLLSDKAISSRPSKPQSNDGDSVGPDNAHPTAPAKPAPQPKVKENTNQTEPNKNKEATKKTNPSETVTQTSKETHVTKASQESSTKAVLHQPKESTTNAATKSSSESEAHSTTHHKSTAHTATNPVKNSETNPKINNKSGTDTEASLQSNSKAVSHKLEPADKQAPQVPTLSNKSGVDPVSSGFEKPNVTAATKGTGNAPPPPLPHSKYPAKAPQSPNGLPPGGSQTEKGADAKQQREGACAAFATAHLVALLLAVAATLL